MNIIELASIRLQQLVQTGVEIPGMAEDLLVLKRGGQAGAEAVEGQSHGQQDEVADSDMRTARNSAFPSRPAVSSGATSAAITLDLQHLEDSGVLASIRSRSTMAEEFRHIKRPLLSNIRAGASDPTQRRSLVMVTSALPGEGKTFCSINLAMSMAIEVDTSVLLVDADVIRANLLQTLGIEPRKGLLDVLTTPSTDLSQVLLRTNVPNLSILPAGTRNLRSTELLASSAMDALMVELASRYPDRIIIFDTTPLLLTSEAKVLASRMGQVVVVVEEAKTPASAISQAFSAIEHCPIVLPVLNKRKQSIHDYGSYYD
ncbi:XrtA-associated tyrosine autokinase [Azohydromonas australica]|uniref:XrtA-associated tyrosine autokinase n=1 Tax=Azohydromonas australica TaxID=364039 RepID=UPI0003FF0443|nr:XrtA-associated tyrosine autokinase [Azohydromonas australica]